MNSNKIQGNKLQWKTTIGALSAAVCIISFKIHHQEEKECHQALPIISS
jgi:hypothetical protein